MQQKEDGLDRKGLSVFSLKLYCGQVTARTTQPQEYPEVLHMDQQIKRYFISLFLAVLLLWCPCAWVFLAEIHYLCKAGVVWQPLSPVVTCPVCVCRVSSPSVSPKTFSPREDTPAVFIPQVRRHRSLLWWRRCGGRERRSKDRLVLPQGLLHSPFGSGLTRADAGI